MNDRNFRKLLIHTCTLIIPGQKIGEDDYGQDIYSDEIKNKMPCRADEIRERPSTSATGTDFILTNMLFLPKEAEISPDVQIQDIIDKENNPVLIGTFGVMNIHPVYDRARLHHYEVSLQRM